MVFYDRSIELFRYEATVVNDGEFWRIFTANLCHSNWNHWALNLIGFWIMDLFFRPVLSIKLRAYLLLFCMFGSVFLLHLWLDLRWYVGLSGALHGYLIGGAILSWQSDKRLNLIIIVIVVAKLFAESFWQINDSTEELIGTNVVEESHSFGAVSALVFCFILFAINKLQKR